MKLLVILFLLKLYARINILLNNLFISYMNLFISLNKLKNIY